MKFAQGPRRGSLPRPQCQMAALTTLERTESLSHLRMFVAERLHLQEKETLALPSRSAGRPKNR